MGFCLIDGEKSPIARLHPVIKGIPGEEQKAGGNIVSFNQKSFASFGKEQGANAPISERALAKKLHDMGLKSSMSAIGRWKKKFGWTKMATWRALRPFPREAKGTT